MLQKLFLFVFVFNLTVGNKLPSTVIKCSRSDSKCIANGMREVLKIVTTAGFPDKGIERANPLRFDDFHVNRVTGNGPRFEVFFKDVKIKGFQTLVVKDLRSDFTNKCRFDTKLFSPYLEIYGTYRTTGMISIFNYKGAGKFKIKLTDVDLYIPVKCKFIPKNDSKYLENMSMRIDIQPRKVHFDFENIFDGNKEISSAINDIFNQNSLLLFQEESVHHSKVFAKKLLQISNKFLSDIPIQHLFLD